MPGAKKNIGIDALPILVNFSQGAGISKFLANLLKAILYFDRENNYHLFLRLFKNFNFDISKLKDYNKQNVFFKKIFLPDKIQKLFWNLKLTSKILEDTFYKDLDIYISTTYFTPNFNKIKVISFIYDITPLKSNFFDQKTQNAFDLLIRNTITNSSLIFTISEHSKNDIIQQYGLSPEKIKIIYSPPSEIFFPQDIKNINFVKEKYNITQKYFIAFGRGKNKNLLTALKAFFLATKNYNLQHQMVIVGKLIESVEHELKSFIKEKGIFNHVIFTGYVPDEELPSLYSGAEALLFLSFYEGFGLPLLEAMSCGTPIIASNTSSIPEVIDNAGLIFDPLDIEGISNAIYTISTNDNLKNELKNKGFEQAKKFSKEEIANKFISTINEIL